MYAKTKQLYMNHCTA